MSKQQKISVDNSNQNGVNKIRSFFNIGNPQSIPTFISGDLTFKGDIIGNSIIEIDGIIIGSITAKTVIIRKNGRVDGNIEADNIIIRGNFTGGIRAQNISILRQASVMAEISYQQLNVEDGAIIDGKFTRIIPK
jgi:cytoskeletal protein CcmA (bactofilin family)